MGHPRFIVFRDGRRGEAVRWVIAVGDALLPAAFFFFSYRRGFREVPKVALWTAALPLPG